MKDSLRQPETFSRRTVKAPALPKLKKPSRHPAPSGGAREVNPEEVIPMDEDSFSDF
jgi:hypothetical protein